MGHGPQTEIIQVQRRFEKRRLRGLIVVFMFLSLILLIVITAGGFGITYVIFDDRNFLWRTAAGHVIGSVLFGLLAFGFANLAGLNAPILVVAALLVGLPVLLLKKPSCAQRFSHDWDKAKGRMETFTFGRLSGLLYYLFFLILFIAFFDRAFISNEAGIFTGGSNNLGDLPYHLGAILSFSEANNFPPQNPSFAGARFTYPFVADFLAACLLKLGAGIKGTLLIQNVAWAFSLLVLLEGFATRLTGSRLAGRIAPFILFFSGGLGIRWFVKDFIGGSQGITEMLWNLPGDYTINDRFRWGNSMTVLFLTQRSILLGMPVTIAIMDFIRDLFLGKTNSPDKGKKHRKKQEHRWFVSSLLAGFVAGSLVLVHAHSLFALFIICAVLLPFSASRLKEWLLFGIGTSLVAVPLLVWIFSGSASNTSEFAAWHFGWDSRGANFLLFWAINTGLFIPVYVFGLILKSWIIPRDSANQQDLEDSKNKGFRPEYLLYSLPFLLIFLVCNIAKFAPWEWDNIKLLIYWF